MARRRFTWTKKQLDKLNKVIEVLSELNDYKPLTLRQIYYQLVGQGYIENKVSQYTMLSKLLKWARIDGYIAWEDIEDRVRAFHDLTGWGSSDDFIQAHLRSFLRGYTRNLLQSQDKYIEIWIEKDALSSIFTRVAEPYTIPVVVCRGFSSVSFLNDFKTRLNSEKADRSVLSSTGRSKIMLYFGDFDPSGVEMLTAMKTTLLEELEVNEIEFKRVALLKDDISAYNLPNNPDALKKTDTRAKKHLETYGELAVELDALRPDILERKITDAIEAELDIEAFNHEIEKHKEEIDKLNNLKQSIVTFSKSVYNMR